jgi:hypothetical protein
MFLIGKIVKIVMLIISNEQMYTFEFQVSVFLVWNMGPL